MCDACWIDLEDNGIEALGVLAVLDPENESEAFNFVTGAYLPTVAVREDLDLACTMMDEAVAMIRFLIELSEL